MIHALPVVAIVGPPNSGKSTLLNRLAGKRIAVTSDVAGTTRDRQYAEMTWNGRTFLLVDTAGMAFNNTIENPELEPRVHEQIKVATEQADVLLLLTDGKLQQPLEQKILQWIRKTKKPTVLGVNKIDSPNNRAGTVAPFYENGVKAVFAISAQTGRGVGDLLDAIVTALPAEAEVPSTDAFSETTAETVDSGIAVSIVGKPNVGKSSLYNALVGETRVVVSPVPGTTRSAIDTTVTLDDQVFTFIDTAGLKRKEHRQTLPDIFSGFHAMHSIRRSDVCLLVLDGTEQVTKQDQHLAGLIDEMGKGAVIVINKMDAYQESEEALRKYVSLHLPFLWYCPMYFISAQTGAGVAELPEVIKKIYADRKKQSPAAEVEALLKKVLKKNPPKRLRDQKEPKVYGLEQQPGEQPTFVLRVNHSGAISQQFRKYLQKSIITELGYWGTPIIFRMNSKDKT